MDITKIKIIMIDVDGTLTDGKYITSDDGTVSKSFYTRDFYAIRKALEKGMNIIIITSSKDAVIDKQFSRIINESLFWDNKFKKKHIKILKTDFLDDSKTVCAECDDEDLDWETVAYIGDAENDILAMKKSNFSACPQDAICEILDAVNYVSDYKGGNGAVYDIIQYILLRRFV